MFSGLKLSVLTLSERMVSGRTTLRALLFGGLILSAVGTGRAESPAPPPSASTCVKVTGRVRYSLGYDHLVDLVNGCADKVVCEVWTNVNPEKQSVSLDPTQSTSVVTFIGSPAREFTPESTCRYASPR